MDKLVEVLTELKHLGCSGIKISFEDEGALYNEVISMRNLTSMVGLELSVKIGGCEAKRDIVDCLDLGCDAIVAPMVESQFALLKFLQSLKTYNYTKKRGFNLETIGAYKNLDDLSKLFKIIDFVTIGRVDLVGSLEKTRESVETEEIYQLVETVFKVARQEGIGCYLGGAISINTKDFIGKLINSKLLDKFETRYVIYDVHRINFNDFEKLLYWGNIFEVEWLKFISSRYSMHANKDILRIKMIENRIEVNTLLS
jgi:4-hydroxy-2-oxoheptanedioate aldolase